ncbi:MAG: hypothetical protein A2046_03365 [Bacteroidetes bacterium GWA2_30_7]|nr:MAG: hypothetical protein A2046_03365 [Bacteroidetes bacterium GWA2_30_7]
MTTIIIETKNENAAIALINFLKALDFKATFKSITNKKTLKIPIEKANKNADFMALAGIWEGKDMSLEQLRDKAWGGRL